MDEMLYDDKLAGEITRERYEVKHADILKQIELLSDELLVAESTSLEQHKQTVNLIRLTQQAKDEYLNESLANDAKRVILTELIESVTLKDNSLSVKYARFVDMIAKKVEESKQKLMEENMLNRTNKKDLAYRGQNAENYQISLLCPIWQGQ